MAVQLFSHGSIQITVSGEVHEKAATEEKQITADH
jgi:hypothetical protein